MRSRHRAPVLWAVAAAAAFSATACQRGGGGDFPMPARLVQALERFSDLEASAELVPAGEAPLAGVALLRGDDGRSFSGFVDAAPGEYTMEIVFRGRFEQGTDLLFLGRWPSNVFTVVEGDSTSPVFASPLDTIERPGDGGDEDGDGLGLLDELLFGSSLDDEDSDDDGILDGDDCRPTATSTGRAAVRGNLEDCDGDQELRPDRPAGTPGRDCDDEDPTINPAATDVCGDGIDQDCNPETCPDETRPVITLLEPGEGADAGCSQRVRARISSESPLTSSSVDFLDGAQVIDSLAMTADTGDVYVSGRIADTSIFLDPGPLSYRVSATDMRGRTSTASGSMNLVLEVPSATMTPLVVGRQSAPFEVTVSAMATAQVAEIILYRAPVVDDEVLGDRGTEIARVSAATLVHTIDPSQLADGEYGIYPVVIDRVGNRLEPDIDFIPDMLPDGSLATDADYLCLFDSGSGNVPVRLLRVGAVTVQPAKMRDLVDQAVALAAARDPLAEPVEIRAFGMQSDGTVPLDEEVGSGGKWWRFVFFNFTDDRRIEVTWYSLADGITSPEVEVTENDPFGFSFTPFADLSLLADSDAVAAAYEAAAGCDPLTGNENDDLRYENDAPFSTADVVHVTGGATDWKATATLPITELSACQ